MAKRKAPKRRAAGGGRKSQGPVTQLRAVMSIRLPTEMRGELQKAAKANGNSVTQELLSRLDASFKQDRKNYRDPATKALCFLFSELAERVHAGTPDWRSDPFLFRAFKIGVTKLLNNLPEPKGKIESPRLRKFLLDRLSADDPMNETEHVKNWRKQLTRMMKSPEALAEFAVENTLAGYFKTDPRYGDWGAWRKGWEPLRKELDADPEIPGLLSKMLQHQDNTYYGMQQARDGLSLKPRRRKL